MWRLVQKIFYHSSHDNYSQKLLRFIEDGPIKYLLRQKEKNSLENYIRIFTNYCTFASWQEEFDQYRTYLFAWQKCTFVSLSSSSFYDQLHGLFIANSLWNIGLGFSCITKSNHRIAKIMITTMVGDNIIFSLEQVTRNYFNLLLSFPIAFLLPTVRVILENVRYLLAKSTVFFVQILCTAASSATEYILEIVKYKLIDCSFWFFCNESLFIFRNVKRNHLIYNIKT